MPWLRRIALLVLGRYGARLRFPGLFLIAALCFGVDLLLPDGLPFLDEIALALLTLFIGAWKRDDDAEADPNDAA